MNVLVTGAKGFIGSNLCERLGPNPLTFDRGDSDAKLHECLEQADFIYHLAGVMRPEDEDEFCTVNVDLTAKICGHLSNPVPIVFASSVQAELDNPYGTSKSWAEQVLIRYSVLSGERVAIYRLKNVFGKWALPNYASVVATFCHNIARDLEIQISDPNSGLELIYIDDVVQHFVDEMGATATWGVHYPQIAPVYDITLGRLAGLIQSFRSSSWLPDLGDEFVRRLYGTYLSYSDELGYALDKHCDDRGCLAEFVKSDTAGQLFVSRTAPGAIRGNHYHRTKAEKFLVLGGQAIVRVRHVLGGEVASYSVSGTDMRVIDIPPGLVHSIEGVGPEDLITLFWASEAFDPENPDTYRGTDAISG